MPFNFEDPQKNNCFYFYDKNKPGYVFTNLYDNTPITIDGVQYPSTEHFYQVQKFTPKDYPVTPRTPEQEKHVREILGRTPREAQNYTQNKEFFKDQAYDRAGWDNAKEDLMLHGLMQKWGCHPELANQLLATGDACLVEDADRDADWGISSINDTRKDPKDRVNGTGNNKLGLMNTAIREVLKTDELKNEPLPLDPNSPLFKYYEAEVKTKYNALLEQYKNFNYGAQDPANTTARQDGKAHPAPDQSVVIKATPSSGKPDPVLSKTATTKPFVDQIEQAMGIKFKDLSYKTPNNNTITLLEAGGVKVSSFSNPQDNKTALEIVMRQQLATLNDPKINALLNAKGKDVFTQLTQEFNKNGFFFTVNPPDPNITKFITTEMHSKIQDSAAPSSPSPAPSTSPATPTPTQPAPQSTAVTPPPPGANDPVEALKVKLNDAGKKTEELLTSNPDNPEYKNLDSYVRDAQQKINAAGFPANADMLKRASEHVDKLSAAIDNKVTELHANQPKPN